MKTKLDISVLEAESRRLGKSLSLFKELQKSVPALKNATAEEVIQYYHTFVFEQNQIIDVLQTIFYEIQSTRHIIKFCRFLVEKGMYGSIKGPEDLLTRAIFTNRTGRTPADKLIKYRQIIIKYIEYKSYGRLNKGKTMNENPNSNTMTEEKRIEKLWLEYQKICTDKKISCGTKETFEAMFLGTAKPFTSDNLLEAKHSADDLENIEDAFEDNPIFDAKDDNLDNGIEAIQEKKRRGRPRGSKNNVRSNMPAKLIKTKAKHSKPSVEDPNIIHISREDLEIALQGAYRQGYEAAKNTKALSSEPTFRLLDSTLLNVGAATPLRNQS